MVAAFYSFREGERVGGQSIGLPIESTRPVRAYSGAYSGLSRQRRNAQTQTDMIRHSAPPAARSFGGSTNLAGSTLSGLASSHGIPCGDSSERSVCDTCIPTEHRTGLFNRALGAARTLVLAGRCARWTLVNRRDGCAAGCLQSVRNPARPRVIAGRAGTGASRRGPQPCCDDARPSPGRSSLARTVEPDTGAGRGCWGSAPGRR